MGLSLIVEIFLYALLASISVTKANYGEQKGNDMVNICIFWLEKGKNSILSLVIDMLFQVGIFFISFLVGQIYTNKNNAKQLLS